MPQKRALVFDLGGVLIDWNPRYLYRKFYGEAETEFFLAHVCTSQWNLALDAGRPYAEAIREKQASWPEYAEAIQWWKTRWEEMLKSPFPETVEILKELKERGHALFALTNWSAETFPLAFERFDFLSWFQEIVVSGEVGLVKPDPAIYLLAAKRCGFAPQEALFIDDVERNVAAARELGFDTIHYQCPAALRQSLLERGLL